MRQGGDARPESSCHLNSRSSERRPDPEDEGSSVKVPEKPEARGTIVQVYVA
jgi:hypothetical protein